MASYDNVKESNLKKIKRFGFKEEKAKSKHEAARYSGISTLVLFKTGKLLVQGSKISIEETGKLLEYAQVVEIKRYGEAVGTDESLKGDTFGGLVVAGFKADDCIRAQLKHLGVRDSKKLSKPDVVRLAQELIEKYPKNYHVENLDPRQYNRLCMKQNITEILDVLHQKCCSRLSKDALHIVDKYPGCSIGNIAETGADSKYMEVAAASVIARYFGLMQIRELEKKAGFFIPLGSTNVESALLEIRKKSLDPYDYVKMNFKNAAASFQ